MFDMLRGIGSTIGNIGNFFITIWDAIKSLFSFLWGILTTIWAIIAGFPVWLASLLFAAALVSIILWITLNR